MTRRVGAGLLITLMCAGTLRAQGALRVLRFSPADSGTAGSLVTVTFDRPVAGLGGSTVDAARVMRLQPEVAGTFEWRDPATLRFVPDDPLAPGTRFTVAVDTAAVASNGVRTAKPFTFEVRIPGARLVRQTIDGVDIRGSVRGIGPLPIFTLLYTGTIASDPGGRRNRLEFPDACGGVVPLREIAQRPLDAGELERLYNVFPYGRDGTGDRFMRVVELRPTDSLRAGCTGTWTTISDGAAGREDTTRIPLTTYPAFSVRRVRPGRENRSYSGDPCASERLCIAFSAPVSVRTVMRSVHTSPPLVLDTTTWRFDATSVLEVSFKERLTPRQAYTITVDSTARDIYGRLLTGPRSFTVMGLDRVAGAAQQNGLVTVAHGPTRPAMVRIRTVNVDTLLMHIVPLPDSFIPRLLATSEYERYGLVPLMAPALRDTIRVLVPVRGTFNQEGNVDVALPSAVTSRSATTLFAVRFEIKAESFRPESAAIFTTLRREQERARDRVRQQRGLVEGLPFDAPDLGLIVQVTSLVAQLKITGSTGVAFVTDRAGRPVPGARATLYDGTATTLSTGVTGGDGLATLAPTPAGAGVRSTGARVVRAYVTFRYVVIERGADRLLVPVNGGIATTMPMRVSSYELGVRGGGTSLMRATLTTDRDLYRSGEMVAAKLYAAFGLMGTRTPIAGDSVRMLLLRGDYYVANDALVSMSGNPPDTIGVRLMTTNNLGTAVDSIKLPETARPGPYLFATEVLHRGRWQQLASRYLRVEAFRAPEFIVKLASDTATRFVGDTIVARLTGTYLFGSPMAGAQVAWSLSSTSAFGAGRAIPRTQGFTIGLADWWNGLTAEPRLFRNGTGRLDANGALTIKIPTTAGSISLPAALRIGASVTDLNNQVVAAQANGYLRTSSVFVALKDRGTAGYWRSGVPQRVEALAVRLSGERVVGAPLHVTIVRRRQLPDTNASRMSLARWSADTVLKRIVSSGRSPVPISFTPATDGAYDVRVETVDERGRTSASNLGRWASASPNNPSVRSRVALKLTTPFDVEKRYLLGDTAKVSFVSPFARAEAWITIEREGVLDQKRMSVARGTTTLNIPIGRRLAPNAFVGVTLVERQEQPRSGIDTTSIPFRAGYTELRVDSSVNRLHVVVDAPGGPLKPGDSVEVRVRVRSALRPGSPTAGSEVALWAVDEGVLSLTGMRTPDIFRAINQELGVGAAFATSFVQFPWMRPAGDVRAGVNVGRLLERARLAAAAERAGDFAGRGLAETPPPQGSPPDLRSSFRLTAFFVGRTTTNASGVAVVRAKLPDNITTFRLMATATGSGGRYGSGDGQLVVARHFVLRPALPRFLRPGDAFSANAILGVRDSLDWSMTVSASVSNATLTGDSLRATTVKGARGVSMRFPVAVPAASAADASRVTFSATNAARTDGDAVATIVPIRPAIVPRAHAAMGVLRDTATVTIALPVDIDASRSRFTVSLGTSPLVAMEAHERRLREHSYLTSDYIAAVARARMSLSKAQRALGVRAGAADSVAALAELQRAVLTLVGRQTPSGGFHYWALGGSANEWMSASIGTFLLDAKRAGAAVPDAAIAGATRAATTWLKEPRAGPDTIFFAPADRRRALEEFLVSRLTFAQFLRRAGAPAVAVEDTLLAMAGRMRWEDRVTLVSVLAERADRRDAARSMLAQLWTAVGFVGTRVELADSLISAGPFVSHVRPIARLMLVTMQLDPTHARLGALREALVMQGASARGWAWNVHDYASAIEALAAIVQREREGPPVRIVARSAGGRVLSTRMSSEVASDALARRVADDTVGQPLTDVVRVRGDTAFMTLTMRVEQTNGDAWQSDGRQFYYAVTVHETPKVHPVTPDIAGFAVERWYEHFTDGTPVTSAAEGDLIRVKLRVTVKADRQFVALEDWLPAGLEIVDLTMRTSAIPGPFAVNPQSSSRARDAVNTRPGFAYGSWDSGWWSPWEYKEQYDDRVVYFATQLWAGTYTTSYIARATTAGTFVRPPAHAVEIYNPAAQGRSDGGTFVVRPPP